MEVGKFYRVTFTHSQGDPKEILHVLACVNSHYYGENCFICETVEGDILAIENDDCNIKYHEIDNETFNLCLKVLESGN